MSVSGSDQEATLMPSLCRLSSGSQFCLSQLQLQAGRPGKMSNCNSCGIASEACSWGRSPGSIQPRDSDSSCSDARSRNTSFMISLMDICNKMILPLAGEFGSPAPPGSLTAWEQLGSKFKSAPIISAALPHGPNPACCSTEALQQDCETCADATDAAAAAAQSPDARSPLATTAASLATCACGDRRCRRRRRCSCSGCRHPGAAATAKEATGCSREKTRAFAADGRGQLATTAARQTNQHQSSTTGRRVGPSWERGSGQNNANSTAGNLEDKKHPPTTPRTSDEDFCKDAMKDNEEADERPLLHHSGLPYWNLAEYQNFRASSTGPTQVFEPMLDTGLHRFMLIQDSHRRLMTAIAGFRAPVYRPY